jgi:IS605 OrfB family transposase
MFKDCSAVLGNKDQVRVYRENNVSASIKFLHIFHRPGIFQTMQAVKTLQVRIKDKHSSLLCSMAREVNQVFNFCNETSLKSIQDKHKWLSGFDLQKLTAGFSKCEGVKVGSSTIQQVCEEYATRRKQFKKIRLNWRVSNPKSPKKSLGWVPFKSTAVKYKAGQLVFAGHKLSLWDSYGLAKYELRAGTFSQDSRGRWYANLCVQVECEKSPGTGVVGIDLGLKTAISVSDGQQFEGRLYRKSQDMLAKAQRAKNKKRVRAIHAKIKNQRKDGLHKFSSALVKNNAAIFVGNVSSAKLVKTKMAKSTLDAGWSMFKTMLEYKCHQAGIVFEEVNEAYTTQTCSQCGSIEGPKGLSGLGIRQWTCSCGSILDRDTNAAKNIAARGLASLAEGAPA